MKIVFLNAWNGKVRAEIADYIKQQALDTDVFCFQEATEDMQLLCADILRDYKVLLADKFIANDVDFSQAIYARQNMSIISSGAMFEKQEDCGLGQYIEVAYGAQTLYICNFHGLPRPGDKLDNPSRIFQSESLVRFFNDKKPAIIGGDFNLLPETKSIQTFRQHGYRDLIEEFKITTTRNQLVWDRYPDNKQYYSDYVFMDPTVNLKGFVVPNNKISDHLPLEVSIDSV